MKNDPKKRRDDKRDQKPPPAGPHDKPELTDSAKTPGTGVLPDENPAAVDGPTG